MMFCIPSLVVISCAIKLTFVDFYRQACYNAPDGQYWAGRKYELTSDATRRVLDGTALYQDYLEQRREQCYGDMLRGSVSVPGFGGK